MKKLILSAIVILLSSSVFATVDGHDKVYIVVEHVQSGEFFVERVPVIGCYGHPRGPQLIQFTTEYKVTSNIGCGAQTFHDNINYLTCAKILSSKDSSDYSSFSEIKLDISKCAAKNDPQFLTMLKTAAKLNFPQKKGEVKLILKK
jgi:hypothetical protein